MDGNSKKLDARPVRNVLANWGGFLITAVVSFFLSPYIVGKLGATSYGVWALIGSFVGYLGLLDLGVRSAVTKFIASCHSAGDHKGASDMKSAAVLVFTVAGLLAVILAAGISPFAEQMFSIPPDLEETAQVIILVSGANIGVSIITGVYGGILAARHRFDLLNIINVILVGVRSTAVVFALKAGQGITTLATIQLLSSIVQLMLTHILSRKVYREAVTSIPQAFSTENIKKLLSFGLTTSMIHILGAIAHNSSLILIGSLLPVAMVTYYSISQSLAEYARTLMSGISQTVTPLVGAMEGAGQIDSIKHVLIDGTRYASLATLPIIATFIVRGESFISLWMGEEYGQLSGQILTILSVALWAMAGYQICTTVMIGLGKHKGMVPIFAVEAVGNIGLSIILIREIGVLGGAWGALIPRLFVALVLCVFYAKTVLHISIREYYINSIARPIMAILPFIAVSYAIEIAWPASNLAVFFLQVALAIPAAILGSWIFGLNAKERMKYVTNIKHRVLASAKDSRIS